MQRPSIEGDTVTLRKEGKQISLRRISSAGEWTVEKATPGTAAETQNSNFEVITLTLAKADSVSVSVEIRP